MKLFLFFFLSFLCYHGVTHAFLRTSTSPRRFFSSSTQRSTQRAAWNSAESEPGVIPPTGFWDPLNLSKDIDESKFIFYREVEIKHGRVAMLAVVGYIVQEMTRFSGTIDLSGTTFESIPNGIAAIGAIPSLGWLQIVASIGYWELIGMEDRKVDPQKPWNFNIGSQFATPEGELKELQNGRLAMLGIMELLTHDIARPPGEGLFVLHHF